MELLRLDLLALLLGLLVRPWEPGLGQWQAAGEEPPQWQAAPRRPPPPSAVLRPLFLLQEGPAEALAACLAPLLGRLDKVLEGSTCFRRPRALVFMVSMP